MGSCIYQRRYDISVAEDISARIKILALFYFQFLFSLCCQKLPVSIPSCVANQKISSAASSGVRGASSPPICVFTQPGVIAETTILFSFKRKARVFVYILIPAFEIR